LHASGHLQLAKTGTKLFSTRPKNPVVLHFGSLICSTPAIVFASIRLAGYPNVVTLGNSTTLLVVWVVYRNGFWIAALALLYAIIQFCCHAANNLKAFSILLRMRSILTVIFGYLCVTTPLCFIIPAALSLPTRTYALFYWANFILYAAPSLACYIYFGYRTVVVLGETLRKRPTPDLIKIRFRLMWAIFLCCSIGTPAQLPFF
jgi:hypothetical protein